MVLGLVVALAVLQGLTEFLPVSSSGHLRVLGEVFGVEDPATLFDIMLHVGTLVAVVVVYRKVFGRMLSASWRFARRRSGFADEPDLRLAVYAIVATIPTGIIAVLLGDAMEGLAQDISFVGAMMLVNGCILLVLGRLVGGAAPGSVAKRRGLDELRLGDALVIGTVQGLGIFRGISRSGSTITTGLVVGLQREAAATFSFVMSVPAILGALVLKFDPDKIGADGAGPYVLGALVAAVVGTAALLVLLRLLRSGRLHHFAWYCFAVGVFAIAWSLQ